MNNPTKSAVDASKLTDEQLAVKASEELALEGEMEEVSDVRCIAVQCSTVKCGAFFGIGKR